MSIPGIVPVTALVDWNAQIHNARRGKYADPLDVARVTLSYVGKTVGRALCDIDATRRFDVTIRIYHGWHKGFQPTRNRRALISVVAETDFAALSRKTNVIIRPNIQFGDRLVAALECRLNRKLAINLPNTLRNCIKNQNEEEEKMVDTALVADVVTLAHQEPSSWLMVLGEDDDLLPGLFTAEAFGTSRSGRVALVRERNGGAFFDLNGLRV